MKALALITALTGLAPTTQHPLVEELVAAFRVDPAEAERRLRHVARTAPPDPALVDAVVDAVDMLGPEGPVAAGVLLRRALRPLDALEAFDRIPGHPAARLEAGWLLAELRLDDLALERFERAPPDPASRYGRAFILARKGLTREALAAVEELLAADPGNPAGSLLLAELLDSAGREDEALPLLRNAVRKRGARDPAALRLARILIRKGDSEEAIDLLGTVVEQQPDHGEAWLALARAHEDAGRIREAADAFRSALEHRPVRNEAQMGLGQLLARTGEREEAARLLHDFRQRKRIADEAARLLGEAEHRPDDFGAARAFVLHALGTGDTGLALRASQRFLVERPEDYRRHLLLARIWSAAGSRTDAARVLRRGGERFRGNPEAVERFRAALAGLNEE